MEAGDKREQRPALAREMAGTAVIDAQGKEKSASGSDVKHNTCH